MKNILIATDFSKEAYCALFYAVQLFRKENARFYISNFYGDKIHTSVYSVVNEEEFRKGSELKIRSQAGCTETFHQVIRDTELPAERFEIISSDRKLIKGIHGLVDSKNIDLVVMGTRKHRGTLESTPGTHTTNLIKSGLTCPILVIPRELDYVPPLKIAFASDLRRALGENISMLKQLALHFNSDFIIVYDGDEGSLNKEQWQHYNQLKSYLDGIPVHLKYSYTHTKISRTLAEFVKENEINLLSMVYYKHSFSDNFFRESVVEKIDRHLSFPFLVLPEKS